MSLESLCQHAVDVATASESAFQIAERMHQRTVGAIVVQDNTNVPIGIVTDRDLVIRVIAAGKDPYTTPVREIMTPSPKTILSTATIKTALWTMRAGEFRRLPIINELGHLIGIVTLDDVLMSLAEELSEVSAVLKEETPRAAAAKKGIAQDEPVRPRRSADKGERVSRS